ncbi:hypothetical protein YC2023_034679 [Brassica napus]
MLRLEAGDSVTSGCPQNPTKQRSGAKRGAKRLTDRGPQWYTSLPQFTQTERRSSTKPWSKSLEEADWSETVRQERDGSDASIAPACLGSQI